MPLQLRDLATGEMIEVPNEGHTIGREGGPADVKLKDKGLSGKHARIFADGTEWLIQDLGSTNGTYLGELKLSATTEIHPNDVITMGATKLLGERLFIAANHFAGTHKTRFACVRFGNVLNSNGSVLQIFRRQLAAELLTAILIRGARDLDDDEIQAELPADGRTSIFNRVLVKVGAGQPGVDGAKIADWCKTDPARVSALVGHAVALQNISPCINYRIAIYKIYYIIIGV